MAWLDFEHFSFSGVLSFSVWAQIGHRPFLNWNINTTKNNRQALEKISIIATP
jgi:hypothetical protein